MSILEKLHSMRTVCGSRKTQGLDDASLANFADDDPLLNQAITEAVALQQKVAQDYPDLIKLPENELIDKLQTKYVNFYPTDQKNPYVALAARGPWLVTSHGAVLHDSGGYGMLGLGHGPQKIMDAMSDNHVIANVMTANFEQIRLSTLLDKEIGHKRGKPAFSKYICMNSGSESVTVASRISDIHAGKLSAPGSRYAGRKVMFLAIEGGFHGRTDRPAQVSSSCLGKYQILASFQNRENVKLVPPNDTQALENVFAWAEKENVFFESMYMEPVMGEGDPGKAVTREFYDAARTLTEKHSCLLVVDSIQAAIRAQGCLSICDYPGFEDCTPPDMETYSKAVNAGQYPLSVLALNSAAADLYVQGVYGNTMTTNPRALAVACSVLGGLDDNLRKNIKDRGAEFVEKFKTLQKELPDIITQVQGTGLLFSVAIDSRKHKIVGFGNLEENLRKNGIGVIHGGENSLRFTPHFNISSKEVDLIVGKVREALI